MLDLREQNTHFASLPAPNRCHSSPNTTVLWGSNFTCKRTGGRFRMSRDSQEAMVISSRALAPSWTSTRPRPPSHLELHMHRPPFTSVNLEFSSLPQGFGECCSLCEMNPTPQYIWLQETESQLKLAYTREFIGSCNWKSRSINASFRHGWIQEWQWSVYLLFVPGFAFSLPSWVPSCLGLSFQARPGLPPMSPLLSLFSSFL